MPQYNASDTRVELQRDSSYGPSGHSSRAFEIMRMARRHSRVVVGTAIAAVAASLLYVSSVTPLYTATATILIDPAASRALEPSKSPVTAADDSAVESQASLIQSESVLQRVVKGLQLASDPIFMPTRGLLDRIETFFSRPSSSDSSLQDMSMARAVETLRRRLAVSRRGSTYLIDVSASSPNRIQATSIANAIARAYEYDQISSRLDAAEAAAGLLRDRIEESKSRVTETEKAIQNYRSSRQSSEATSSGKGEPAPRQDSDSRVQNLDELLRQVETDRAVYERYLARYTDAGARKGMELPGSRIISAASPPIKPSFPDTTAVLGIGLMIGLLTGGLIAIAVDHLDRRIKTPEQAGVSGAPNIAALPEIGTRELAHLARSGKGDLENYDPRRTRLLPHGLQPPVLRYAVARVSLVSFLAVYFVRFTWAAIVALSLAYLIAAIVAHSSNAPRGQVKLSDIPRVWREIRHFTRWTIVEFVADSLQSYGMNVAVAFSSGPVGASIFATTRNIVAPVYTLTSALGAEMPRLARSYTASGVRGLTRDLRSTQIFMLFVSVPYLLAVVLFSEPLLRLFYGAKYNGLSTELRLWALTALLLVIIRPLDMWLLASLNARTLFMRKLVGALVTIGVAAFLLPTRGVEGALYAIAAGMTCNMLGLLMSVYGKPKITPAATGG
jgi:capsular polysaccharide biosynthesis protein